MPDRKLFTWYVLIEVKTNASWCFEYNRNLTLNAVYRKKTCRSFRISLEPVLRSEALSSSQPHLKLTQRQFSKGAGISGNMVFLCSCRVALSLAYLRKNI